MNITYVYADNKLEWNCSEWRCMIPARAVNKLAGHSAETIYIGEFANRTPRAQAACERADIIIVQRTLWAEVLDAIAFWKERQVVVADFDDAYDLMPESNPAYPFWGKGLAQVKRDDGQGYEWRCLDRNPLDEFKRGLRLVHAATTPSRQLAEDWRGYAQMYYVPNYLDLEKYIFVSKPIHEGIVIGWGGSASHLESFRGSGIIEALQRICAERFNVRVMIAGSDRRIFDLLPLSAGRKIYQPFVEFRRWPYVLAQFDIGIAPLHGSYDERRSWIKALEYMAMKIPWIASRGAPYSDLKDYGLLVENTPEAWADALLEVIDHLADYRARAERAGYIQALLLSMDVNVDKVLQTYAEIIQLARTGRWDQRRYAIKQGHEMAALMAR